MKDWFLDFLVVLAYSKKTQWAIILGAIGFVTIHLWGNYHVSDFQLQGPMSGLTDVIRAKLLKRYDKAALGCLVSFGLLAVKTYQRDKKRLFRAW